MARSRLREEQVLDVDFLSEEEHTALNHYFTALVDSPTTFSGQSGKYVRVKSNETELEFGTVSAGSKTWVEKTSNYTASVDDNLVLNSIGGSFTIIMPSSPSIGNTVSFIDGEGYCEINTVTISGAGEKIMGLDENMNINENYAAFDLVYYDSGDGWIIK